MKKRALAAVLFVVCTILTWPAFAEVTGTARLSLLQGEVLVQSADTGNDWVAASINMPLMPGDRIWVPENSRAEIQFLGGTYLRADSITEVDITSLRREGEDNIVQVGIPQGRVYVKYRRAPFRNSVFQVDSPLASAVAYDSAEFDVAAYENGYTEVSVLDGIVNIGDRNGNTKATRGNMISFGMDHYAEISPLRPKDDWIRWNMSRDSRYTRTWESSRYLPPALESYSSDFDEYGRWFSTPDYGYVWSPRVMVRDWAPYRTGRWVWMNGDYVWVSYEPWGWAPYHYGRWAYRNAIGWFWVPPAINAVFWSPGFVAWIQTPAYISWVPLGPRETYYGHGYYGPHSVDIRKVNIKNINITNIYMNSRVTNAVTVVHRDTFLTGRHANVVNAPGNPFTSNVRVSPGRPDIRPMKASYAPMPTRPVSARALPSGNVTDKRKLWGIEQRPVAVKESVSLFTGKTVSPMPVRKIAKPKSTAEVRKAEIKRYPSQQETKTMREVMPKEDVSKPVVRQKEKGAPEMQRQVREKPVILPKDGTVNPSVRQQGTVQPSKGVSAPPSTAPGGSIKKTHELKRQPANPPGERKIKEQPTVIPQEKSGKPAARHQEEGSIRPQTSVSDRLKMKSKEPNEPRFHTKEQSQKQNKKGIVPEG